jgi:hypothetical protein
MTLEIYILKACRKPSGARSAEFRRFGCPVPLHIPHADVVRPANRNRHERLILPSVMAAAGYRPPGQQTTQHYTFAAVSDLGIALVQTPDLQRRYQSKAPRSRRSPWAVLQERQTCPLKRLSMESDTAILAY